MSNSQQPHNTEPIHLHVEAINEESVRKLFEVHGKSLALSLQRTRGSRRDRDIELKFKQIEKRFHPCQKLVLCLCGHATVNGECFNPPRA